MDKDFKGKAAVVTGGASGIGAAIARELAARGAAVLVADLEEESAKAMATEICDAGGTAEPFAVDVVDAAQVEAMVERAREVFGGLHLAVNNAGIGGPSERIGVYPLDGWRQVIDVNLTGVFHCLRYEIPRCRRRAAGPSSTWPRSWEAWASPTREPMSRPSTRL
jgi:NAD(P)-dependent dehydrogenase (short-subunit alcohol dehydrogenase family)